ncbi:Hypothetical protein A7982_07240 [Minicystis rosea]|nr:Hypothetical protein A7982_07240 [Minicystis rosea]
MTVPRRRSRFAAGLMIAALLLAGCKSKGTTDVREKIPAASRLALEQATDVELLSLEPHFGPVEKGREAAPFHGCEILGKTKIEDASIRRRLVTALEKAAQDNDGVAAACFEPHHALRVTHGGRTLDFVICFQCLQVQVFEGDERTTGFLITDAPRALFDDVLRDAHVRLPAGK